MKKIVIIAAMLLGVNAAAVGQGKVSELFTYGTNTATDGYVHGGVLFSEWGLYGGFHFADDKVVNTGTGTVSNTMRFGVMKNLKTDKWIVGAGVQPASSGTKPHGFIGYNPLKSKDMKLWLVGNITGSVFSYGAGLSYKMK